MSQPRYYIPVSVATLDKSHWSRSLGEEGGELESGGRVGGASGIGGGVIYSLSLT